MADFSVDDIDISPSEFLDACSNEEVDELIHLLIEDGYINAESVLSPGIGPDLSIDDEIFLESLAKLSQSRHRLTNEEEEIIKIIAKRL
jgi:hypothetical protein